MSLSPALGAVHGEAQVGSTVAVNLWLESPKLKSIDVSDEKVVEVNAGAAPVEIVTDADACDVYQEQSSTSGDTGFVDAPVGATYESTEVEFPLIAKSRPLYFVESECVRTTASFTPSRCQAHCGTVPIDEPVEFDPVSAVAEVRPVSEIAKPKTAIGAITIAANFFIIKISLSRI